MSLVQQYAGLRVWKARKPEWQDVRPDTPEGRETYAIAAKFEPRFARVWSAAVKEMLPVKMPRGFRDAVSQQSVSEAFQILDPLREKAFEQFRTDIENEYAAVMQAAGEDATEDLNKRFKTNLGFAIAKAMGDVREAAKEFTIPVNPYSIEWMEQRSLELVKDFAAEQTETIQEILSRNFEEGLRAELVYEDIKDNIGLLPREYQAVENRKALLAEQGYTKTEIKQHAAWYRNELLKKRAERIARTETIQAQARGRLDAWKVARDSGRLPPVEREWHAPPPGPSPNRPCKICIDLHGKRAELDGAYDSAYLGAVEAPTAHPHCRCSETLVRAKE